MKMIVRVNADGLEKQLLALQSLSPDMLSDAGKKQTDELKRDLRLAAETTEALNRKPGRRSKQTTIESVADGDGVENGC